MKKIIMVGFFVFLSLIFIQPSSQTISVDKTELLYASDSIETLQSLENRYPVSLIDFDGRIGVFKPLTNHPEELIQAGFVYQGQLETIGNPWSKPIVNDPYYSGQYGIPLTNVDDAWSITHGSESVVIAIIDTGIDTDHEDFLYRLSELSYNSATDQVGLEYVEDDDGHGTMVAGVIGANQNNSIGIAGITNYTQLMIIKANDAGDDTFDDSDIIRGIYYAVDHGANIINLSLGGTYANPLTNDAVNYAYEHNVLVVAAAGNDGNSDVMYPASFENALSVGSVDEDAIIATYSNFNEYVDIAAPGSSISTTDLNNTYVSVSGTSFASPFVAGIAGLYYSLYPDAPVSQVRNVLLSTATDKGTVGVDDYYGYGLINAIEIVSVNHFEVTAQFPDGLASTSVFVEDGGLWVPPETPEILYYEFEGWYLDTDYTVPFSLSTPITSDLTIYAHYVQVEAMVSFYIDGLLSSAQVYDFGTMPTIPSTTQPGLVFHGWYADSSYTTPVTVEAVFDHTVYYGYFEVMTYQMVFLDYDDVTPLETVTYSVSNPLVEIDGPVKPASEAIDFLFLGWDYVDLYSNAILYATPHYEIQLNTDLLGLNPSVDTLYQNDTYTSGGAYSLTDEVTIVESGVVNTHVVGTTSLYYNVYYNDELVYQFIRIVTVLERPVVNDITLNKGVATLLQGSHYVEEGATSSYGDVTILGSVDESTPGIYQIVYQLTVGDTIIQKSRYVVVVEYDQTNIVPIMPTIARKDDDDEINL